MTEVAELAAGGEAVKSGPLGLVVILVLAVACYFLFKSLSKHLRTVRDDFPTGRPADPADPAETAADPSDAAAADAQPPSRHEDAPPPSA